MSSGARAPSPGTRTAGAARVGPGPRGRPRFPSRQGPAVEEGLGGGGEREGVHRPKGVRTFRVFLLDPFGEQLQLRRHGRLLVVVGCRSSGDRAGEDVVAGWPSPLGLIVLCVGETSGLGRQPDAGRRPRNRERLAGVFGSSARDPRCPSTPGGWQPPVFRAEGPKPLLPSPAGGGRVPVPGPDPRSGEGRVRGLTGLRPRLSRSPPRGPDARESVRRS